MHYSDSHAATAQNALGTAFADAGSRTPTSPLSADGPGQTLPGNDRRTLPTPDARYRAMRFRLMTSWRDLALFALTLAGLVWLVLRGEERLGYSWHWRQIPCYFRKVVDGQWIAGPLIKGLGVTLEIT